MAYTGYGDPPPSYATDFTRGHDTVRAFDKDVQNCINIICTQPSNDLMPWICSADALVLKSATGKLLVYRLESIERV